jgi:hypothetical protein
MRIHPSTSPLCGYAQDERDTKIRSYGSPTPITLSVAYAKSKGQHPFMCTFYITYVRLRSLHV